MQTVMCNSVSRPMVAAPTARPSLRSTRSRITPRATPPRPTEADPNNPLDQAAKEFEDKVAKPVAEYTQEASGLNAESFNKTARSASNDEVGAFAETMSFAGLAPEIINGRGAMLGMLAAFGAELRTHQPVLVQVQQTPVFILAAFGTVILASVIPIIRGAELNISGAGPFTQRAEVWNGRLAMVAFAALLAVETFKGGPGLVP